MKVHMLSIGEAMHEKYDWVEKETPLYLVMDNAVGHGTRDCINPCFNLVSHMHEMVMEGGYLSQNYLALFFSNSGKLAAAFAIAPSMLFSNFTKECQD
jgi:hypothetical protein